MTLRITFDPERHEYRADDRLVPSVTRIVDVADPFPPGIPIGVRDAARWRGTCVHTACQFLDDGDLDWESVDPAHRGYVRAWDAARAALGGGPVAVEEIVYHPGLWGVDTLAYAGTLDRRWLDRDGRRLVLDLKTSATMYGNGTGLQLAGYAQPGLLRVDAAGAAVPVDPVWAEDADRMAVHLAADGRFTLVPCPDRAADDADWLAAAMLHARRERYAAAARAATRAKRAA